MSENPITKESIQSKIEERGKTLQQLQEQGKKLSENIRKGQAELSRLQATAQELVGAIKQLQELKATISPETPKESQSEAPSDDQASEN